MVLLQRLVNAILSVSLSLNRCDFSSWFRGDDLSLPRNSLQCLSIIELFLDMSVHQPSLLDRF